MKNADRLVKRLAQLGITVHGASFHILRNYGQPQMNKAAGEAAPCWELRANPLRHHKWIVSNGSRPNVDLPNGCQFQNVEVYGYQPLTHILKTPLEDWDVDIDEAGRLLVNTNVLPESWL